MKTIQLLRYREDPTLCYVSQGTRHFIGYVSIPEDDRSYVEIYHKFSCNKGENKENIGVRFGVDLIGVIHGSYVIGTQSCEN